MVSDTKEMIIQTVKTLLFDQHVKKLTVKDITEACHITRQAFYYHFEDMTEVFRYIMEKEMDCLLKQTLSANNPEDGIRCFFIMAISSLPYMKKGKTSNYGAELEQLQHKYVQSFLNAVVEAKRLYREYSREEVDFIVRYHSRAVIGILEEWTEKDTKNLDQIVHMVSRLMADGIAI